VKYETVIAALYDAFWYKTEWKNTIIFNSDLQSVSVLSNVDRKYYQCIPQKEVDVQMSKRRCTVGWYKGDMERSHPLFSVRKQRNICFENIISPSQRTCWCRNWVASPLAASISCCLTRGSLVFVLNRQHNL
jgi:hypothetical protein